MKTKNLNIDTLVSKILKSDESAFRELFDEYYPRLLNYAFVIIKNHESAEDIVLEVFHSIWERRKKLNKIDRFENYLYVCTKNRTLDYLRQNSRLLKISFSEPRYDEHIIHQNPETKLLNEELLATIDKAILNLPEKTKLVYRMVKEDGLKYQEAADLMGVSVKTVNNQLLRAMKIIRSCVSDYLQQDNQFPLMKALKSFLF